MGCVSAIIIKNANELVNVDEWLASEGETRGSRAPVRFKLGIKCTETLAESFSRTKNELTHVLFLFDLCSSFPDQSGALSHRFATHTEAL
jgi:hypothetical protein